MLDNENNKKIVEAIEHDTSIIGTDNKEYSSKFDWEWLKKGVDSWKLILVDGGVDNEDQKKIHVKNKELGIEIDDDIRERIEKVEDMILIKLVIFAPIIQHWKYVINQSYNFFYNFMFRALGLNFYNYSKFFK